MPSTVQDKDRGYRKLILSTAKIKDGVEREITIGVHSDEGAHDSGMSILEIATLHEFGGSDDSPPERSFIRAWADEQEAENVDLVGLALEQVVMGNDEVETALGKVAALYVASIKARITGGIDPENAESTKDRKGSSTPLIDKSQLLGAINAKVDGSKI